MAKFSPSVNSFTSGEFSPKMDGRQDFGKYSAACTTLVNAQVFPQGGVTRRSGTVFVGEAKDSSKATRVVPFEFSVTQAYMLEFGENYIRFYRNNGRVLESAKTITNITQANPAVVTSASHSYANGDWVYVDAVAGMTEVNGKYYVVANQATNTFELTDVDGNNVDSSGYTAYSSAGTAERVYEITTTYAEADLFDLQFTQSHDVLYVVHPSYKPQEITRTGHTSWTIGNYAPTADPFTSTDNYPRAVTIYEQRLIFAGTNNNPQTLYGSKSDDYGDMTVGTAAADAWTYTIGSHQVNVIRWLASGSNLLIGTSSKSFSATGGTDEGITPTNVRITAEDAPGSMSLSPVIAGNKVIYVHWSGKKVRNMRYDFNSDGFIAPDMSILADHIFSTSSVVDYDFQEEPDDIIWFARADGVLAGLTYKPEQDITAWHRHTTTGSFESVASIPTTTEDQTWFVVNRTVNGTTRRYIEYFGDEEWLTASNMVDNKVHTDSSLIYSGSAVSSVSGLDHLEGMTVDVVVDGSVHPQRTVASGAISLEISGEEIEVGLHYDSEVKPMRPEIEAFGNTQQGKSKRWNNIIVRLLNTVGVDINGDQVPFRKTSDNMDTAVPLFSGDKRVSNSGFDTDGFVTIKQEQPLPMTLLLITGEIGVSNR